MCVLLLEINELFKSKNPNMPQAGFDPAQSEVCYQTTALPPSHYGWTIFDFMRVEVKIFRKTVLEAHARQKNYC